MAGEEVCPVCKKPLDVCPYGGDCGEMQLIYRQRQREILADLEPPHGHCTDCGEPLADPNERWGVCDSCQDDRDMENLLREADDA